MLTVVLAAWGWRIMAGRGLDLLPWRIVATLLSMLTLAIAFCAVGLKPAPGAPAFEGAFGRIIGSGILSILPTLWGSYALAIAMLVVAFGSLYMACALTLGEWHIGAKLLHRLSLWSVRQTHRGIFGLWHLLRNEQSGGDHYDFGDDEEPPEEEEENNNEDMEEEADEKPEEKAVSPVPKRARQRAPLIKRPAASARQARLALRAESDYPLPPLDLLQWPEDARRTQTADFRRSAGEKRQASGIRARPISASTARSPKSAPGPS